MGVALPLFALAFNALLWLARLSLSPMISARAGQTAGWCVALLGPLALLALAWRIELARRERLLLVAAVSLACAGMLSGL